MKFFDLKLSLSSEEISALVILLADLDRFSVFHDGKFCVKELYFSSEFFEFLISSKHKFLSALNFANQLNNERKEK